MLIVSDLSVRYGMHEALSSLSLQVAEDEIVVMLGANGAGKSTLLKAIAGVCEGQSEGHVTLGGDALTELDAAQIVERGIAFVPEGRGIFGDLTVQENLQLGSYAEHARHNEQENLAKVHSLFPKLAERKGQIARTMSGGEQQMVAIGRALMSAPSILMLDEPSLGLSPLLCKELFASLKLVRASGVGILLVEQNAKQSLNIADRGYLLGNGEIIGQDSATNLLNDPLVQSAYLGGASAKPIGITAAGSSRAALVKKEVNAGSVGADVASTPIAANSSTDAAAFALSSNNTSDLGRSSDALLGEDIDSLVARATNASIQHQKQNSQTLRSSAVPASTERAPVKHATTVAGNAMDKPSLAVSQDTQVQQLLADFETAARNASSCSKTSFQASAQPTVEHVASGDTELLPTIPVYRKSSVTVYRRDTLGNLRKQEKR